MANKKPTAKANVTRKATSIWVDPMLWKRLRERAVHLDLNISEAVDAAISHWLSKAA